MIRKGLLLVLMAMPVQARELHLPWREAGLTQQEAAAHMLDRLAYGPTPGGVDAVCRQGLEAWFGAQLRALAPEPRVPAGRSDANGLRQRKLLRAVSSPNQLQEVLTEFWFNHFNVSTTVDDARPFIASYEADAIRPNALGSFRKLLEATSHHPAMLYYLGNTFSKKDAVKTTRPKSTPDPLHLGVVKVGEQPASDVMVTETKSGLNENYARELMELHTLGVDGGYRQEDVTQVARVFTGWCVVREGDPKVRDRPGHFEFDASKHDPEPKRVMFQTIPAGGEDEGEKVLDLLSTSSACAKFISRKLAVRFVCDAPSPTLVASLARTFQRSRGDVRELMSTLVESPDFWSRENLHAKVKTPLELEASAIRILGGRVSGSSQLPELLNRMGMAAYGCPPPTGFPDRADYWVSPGNLMQRLSFAVELAGGHVSGVTVDLSRLAPLGERIDATLPKVAAELLPGRDVTKTDERLRPSVQDVDYGAKVTRAARERARLPAPAPQAGAQLDQKALANMVGLLLGSPEFQRR